MNKVLVINLGTTSTKVAYYEERVNVNKATIDHSIEELGRFPNIWDQLEFRREAILAYSKQQGIEIAALDCVISRGGNTEPIESGVYQIDEKMIRQSASRKYGEHPFDLGLQIAYDIGKAGPLALTADTPSTDEFQPLARYSGLKEVPRRSCFHALNHKAAARRFAKDHNLKYEELNLIVVHLGTGISIAAHKNGKVIDANNALDGDGPFTTHRTGTLPVGALVELCFQRGYTFTDLIQKTNRVGGITSYLDKNDLRELVELARQGDVLVGEVLEAMCYQIAKEIGAYATVLSGEIDAIVITGGMANAKWIIEKIQSRVMFLAPVSVYPGEFEIEALASNAFNALERLVEIKHM